MPLTFLKFDKILVCGLSLLAVDVSAKAVHDLSQFRPQLTAKDGKALYDKSMNGEVAKTAFGAVARNDVTTAQALTALVLPKVTFSRNHATQWGLIGKKPWQLAQSIHPNTSVSVVTFCYSDQPLSAYTISQAGFSDCALTNRDYRQVALAVISEKSKGDYTLLAQPYIEKIDSQNSDTSAFRVANIQEDGESLGNLDRLDMANYRLNANTPAFGVRYSTSVGYAGGGASHQGMTLFAIIDGKLKPVLHLPLIYQYENLAGEWHKDGTREHDISETKSVLKIANHHTAGFADIILHHPKDAERNDKTYHWNATLQQYE